MAILQLKTIYLATLNDTQFPGNGLVMADPTSEGWPDFIS